MNKNSKAKDLIKRQNVLFVNNCLEEEEEEEEEEEDEGINSFSNYPNWNYPTPHFRPVNAYKMERQEI